MKNRKSFIWGGAVLLLLLIGISGVKVGRVAWNYKQNNDRMINSLYEAYSLKGQVINLDTAAHRVLCIGNSITWHAPLKGDLPGADSLWRGDWGMCASKPEFDFVHQLERKFKAYNPATTVDRINLWEWEHDFNLNMDSLLGSISKDKDLIILKIGENVKKDREEQFQQAFDELVNYCLQNTPNVIIAGSYWKAPRKEQAMISAARKYHLPYVPLFWIYENYRNEVLAHVGDTIFDRHGQPYSIPTEFICTHPNDEGMRMIADAIFNSIQFVN